MIVNAMTGMLVLGLLWLALLAALAHALNWIWQLELLAEPVEFAVAALLALAAAHGLVRLGRCIWATDAPPSGVLLCRKRGASLYAKVERMGRNFGGIAIHGIWVTEDMNAVVLQRPRWGVIGPMENHLLIGLQLTHSVSSSQLSAVLAHELAHLTAQRTGWAAWGRHLRSWWFRVVDKLVYEAPRLAELCDWLTARDVERAIELSRLEEFEADALAAQMVGAELVAGALLEVAVSEHFILKDYWERAASRSRFCGQLTFMPFRELASGMSAAFHHPAVDPAVLIALSGGDGELDHYNPHPSLAERLQALGVDNLSELTQKTTSSAAQRYLAEVLPAIAEEFDRMWWGQIQQLQSRLDA
jgi:hypothetical protein